MRHGKKYNHLGRKAAHRKALLRNMAISLIEHKAIKTTLPKARELRKFIEPLITKAKNDNMHSRRVIFSYLQNKEAVKELFQEVAARSMDRPGGYTRILKLGNRLGDNAEMAYIELVDFNEFDYTQGSEGSSRRKRRRRKSGKKKDTEQVAAEETVDTAVAQEVVETPEDAIEEAEIVEEVVEEVAEEVEETAEEVKAEETETSETPEEDNASEEKKGE